MFLWGVILLALTNIATVIYFLRRGRPKLDPKTEALVRLVRIVERDGHAILKIELMNPDHFFLRAPSR